MNGSSQWLIAIIFCLVVIAFIFGKVWGRYEQAITLDEMTGKQWLLYYLEKGQWRHEKDLVKIRKDIRALKAQGVRLPDEALVTKWVKP